MTTTEKAEIAKAKVRTRVVNDIIQRDDKPPIVDEQNYRRWLGGLTDIELGEYYQLVKQEHPN